MTLAVNCCVAPVAMLAVVGEMETEFTTGAATVTTALAVFVGSARLVTVIVAVPGVAAAVKTPEEEIVPELVDQAMDLLLTVPWTVALNCSVPPVATDRGGGRDGDGIYDGRCDGDRSRCGFCGIGGAGRGDGCGARGCWTR